MLVLNGDTKTLRTSASQRERRELLCQLLHTSYMWCILCKPHYSFCKV